MDIHTETLDFSFRSKSEIDSILLKHELNLSADEALIIQNEFLKRPPSYAECVLWSIQGSEHCSYKSSRVHLKHFNTQGPGVILGAKEDAGIVALAEDNQGYRYGIIVSHESHNHPSQIVPFEGAATGVGGNVRDVCCMGGEVIAVADSLRFGDINRAHTHWISEGVIAGIAGYGNPLGIPNIAGDIYYDKGYNENCLVTVVTLGVVREDEIIHSYAPPDADDYVFILVGKPTDNSGFGGASFASTILEEDAKEKNKGAVQEPNAFLQRHILKANYALFNWIKEQNLVDKVGFKDLGAGGIGCASIELAEAGGDYGAEIYLENVPVSMKGLHPAVILCSETQERFMWVVSPDLADHIINHYNKTFDLPNVSEGACASVVGKIRTDGRYVVSYHGVELVHAKVPDVTKGIVYNREYTNSSEPAQDTHPPKITDFNSLLIQILSHENIASRAPVCEQYDKQVQGRTILEAGCADAGVMQPFNEEKYPPEIRQVGLALSLDHNPRYNLINPYWGAVNAVAESVRNITAVGATPIALTDCLCFGNPEKPEQMGKFVESVHGIVDACKAIHLDEHPNHTLPVIAGNVSLYNESAEGSIPPSPMLSCLGKIPDVSNALSYDFKQSGSHIVMIGERKKECGGSVFYQLYDILGFEVPKPDLIELNRQIKAVYEAISKRLVLSAHDISDGGIAVALSEMSFKRLMGFSVTIPGTLELEELLFSETGGFILEVESKNKEELCALLNSYDLSYSFIGMTHSNPVLDFNSVINLPISKAKYAWEHGLREKLL